MAEHSSVKKKSSLILGDIFEKEIYRWFKKHGRDLPWRQTKDPYAIWVSEVMLQQTQVDRVKAFYERFMQRFPSVEILAKASWEELLEYWRGLGYYRRAKNLQRTAGIIVEKHQGHFPHSFAELQKLPGIGVYTAAAIASFAFGQKMPALDTNLKRIFGRIFWEGWDSLKLSQQFDLASSYMISGKADTFNHALMDIGAMICSVRIPNCPICPFQKICDFSRNFRNNLDVIHKHEVSSPLGGRGMGMGKVFPKKLTLADQTSRFYSAKKKLKVAAGVIIHDGKILISKRRADVPFGDLWEFPGGKLEEGEDERTCLKRELREELDIEVAVRPPFYRVETEREGIAILLSFHRCSLLLGEPKALEVQEFAWVEPERLLDYHFPPVNKEVIEVLLRKKRMWILL